MRGLASCSSYINMAGVGQAQPRPAAPPIAVAIIRQQAAAAYSCRSSSIAYYMYLLDLGIPRLA